VPDHKINGEQSIRMVKSLMFFSRQSVMVQPQNAFSKGYCDRMEVNPGRL
jgi:hypothetical protein